MSNSWPDPYRLPKQDANLPPGVSVNDIDPPLVDEEQNDLQREKEYEEREDARMLLEDLKHYKEDRCE